MSSSAPRTDAADMPKMPAVVDGATWQAKLDELRVREKARTHEGDATAAARRWLPTVAVDPAAPLIGTHGPVPRGWEVSGAQVRANGRPTAQWSRLAAGRCGDLFAAGRS
jgi:hypothetical protein